LEIKSPAALTFVGDQLCHHLSFDIATKWRKRTNWTQNNRRNFNERRLRGSARNCSRISGVKRFKAETSSLVVTQQQEEDVAGLLELVLQVLGRVSRDA
jgi:hypothetical protein